MSDSPLGFDPPTTAQVHAALARLTSLQLRRAFYGKLINPLWVAALRAEGAFSNPPSIEHLEDGSYRVDPWPEIDFLVRMAPLAPQEVTYALKSAANTDNPWVRRGIWEAAAVLPAACAAQLSVELKSWAEENLGNSRTDAGDVSRVIVNLLEGGEHNKGAQLADAFYQPRPPKTNSEFGRSEPTSGIEPYWYVETLPAVSEALGSSRLRTLRRWLEKYQLDSKCFDPQSDNDTSHIWRPSVSGAAEHYMHEMGDALVEALHRAGLEAVTVKPTSLDTLLGSKQPLLRRIAITVLGEVLTLERNPERDRDPDSKARRTELFSRASAILSDESFAETAFRPEFAGFVRATALWPDDIDSGPFTSVVKNGPLAIRDARQSRFARKGETEAETAARVQDFFLRWQHMLLAAVGFASLNPTLQALLAELDEAKGVIDNPTESAWQVRSFTGPTSPLEPDQITSMSNEELLQQLRTWHPEPDSWRGPSHEGQGRAVSEALTTQPGRLADIVREVKFLRPTYVRAILRGWQLAHEAGGDLPWTSVIELCQWAAELSDDSQIEGEGDEFDDDRDNRNLKLQAVQLLESGLGQHGDNKEAAIPITEAESVERILTRFAGHTDPSENDEAKLGGDNMDPLTLSLNTIRPVAIRSLIKLVHRYPESTATQTALKTLEGHLQDHDPSLTVASVYGEGIGRLYDSVKEWATAHVDQIFGTVDTANPQHQVAFSTALAVHHYHPALLELLRSPFLEVLKSISSDNKVLGWKAMRSFAQLVGDWILISFVTGGIELDDELMVEWFKNADPVLRGEVIGHVGWQMMHWTEIDDKVLVRATDLWDSRTTFVKLHPSGAQELAHFYWFIRSGKLESTWWLPRLLEVALMVPDFQPRGMLGQSLGEAGSQDPDTALAVLEILMGGVGLEDQASHYDLYENAVPQVLACALDADIPELTLRANALANKLGAAGYIDVLDRVKSRRGPTS